VITGSDIPFALPDLDALLREELARVPHHAARLPAGRALVMQACAANGMQDLDHSALVRALELMANHTVAPDPKA